MDKRQLILGTIDDLVSSLLYLSDMVLKEEPFRYLERFL